MTASKRGLMEHFFTYNIDRADNISRNCFVCGIDNPSGLHAKFYITKEGDMLSIGHPNIHHQSYPGRTHGGIAASLLDETIGRAINTLAESDWGVTISLNVTYRKPLPLDTPVYCRARITEDTPRIFSGIGEIVLEDGTVAAQAEGRFMRMTIDKIAPGTTLEALEDMSVVVDPAEVPKTIDFPTKTGLEFARRRS